MNLTFSTVNVPEYGSYRIYQVDSNSTLSDIDDALYYFESPYYRYCASGAGCNPESMPGWNMERQRLTQLWMSKHTFIHTKPTHSESLWDSIKAFFK